MKRRLAWASQDGAGEFSAPDIYANGAGAAEIGERSRESSRRNLGLPATAENRIAVVFGRTETPHLALRLDADLASRLAAGV